MTLFEISLYQFLQTFYNLLISVPPSIKVTKLSKTMPAPAATENSSNQTTADAAATPPAAPLQRKKSVSKSAQTDSESSIEEISVAVNTKVSSAGMSQPSMATHVDRISWVSWFTFMAYSDICCYTAYCMVHFIKYVNFGIPLFESVDHQNFWYC